MDSLYSAFILEADGPVFDEITLFEYGLAQPIANVLDKTATRVHTNIARAGYAGLPLGHEFYVSRWRAVTNLRREEPLLDWASESSAQLIYNNKTIMTTPLIDLLMAPQMMIVESTDQAGQPTLHTVPLWMRENVTFSVLIQTSSRLLEQLQQHLLVNSVSRRMIFWIHLDGLHRKDVL